jgi:molybdopterin/thiamine biosynthesis adenylyltransferase
MKPEHVVTIVGVGAAVAVVALFLIAIVVELRRTHLQLVTILGAVSETVSQTDGLDAITTEIAADIAAGQALLTDCVDRLEQRLGSEGNGTPPPTYTYTNY